MHLAIVRASYTAFGGAERIVNRIVVALAAAGVEITILARRWSADATEAVPPSVHWRRVDPFFVGNAWRMASFARAVRRATANAAFDLVQSHERIAGVSLYRAGDGVHREWLVQRARVRGRPASAFAALSPQHRVQLAAERAMFEHPRLRAVICNSQMVRDEIQRWFGVPAGRLVLIRNGVDLAQFRPPTAEERAAARSALRRAAGGSLGKDPDEHGAPVFLLVGSGFERKGVAAALRALGRMRTGRLVIVGGDRRAARYHRLAEHLGVGARVHFAGPQRSLLQWYHAADVFVLPSLYDPQPNAVLEAMACGLPIVTTFKCGASELLDAASGAVCDALDIDALAAALQRFADPDRARAAGARARAAIEPYGLERMSTEYLALYRQLLGAPQ